MSTNTEVFMKSIALAVLIATLAGCAIVPIGPPPIYVGVHAHGGYGYGGGYYGGRGGYRY
jgi:hypothetical protein